MGLTTEHDALLEDNLIFYRDTIHSGADFAKTAEVLIKRHQPDLVWGDPLLNYFGDMPPLDHYPLRDYREFRWEDSEVVEYLISNPKFMSNLFSAIRDSGAIVFDPETRTWKGYRHGGNNAEKLSCCQKSLSKSTLLNTRCCQNPMSPHKGGTWGIFVTASKPLTPS